MATVGTYYITVIPDMSKFSKGVSDAGISSGKSFGNSFVSMIKASAIGSAIGGVISKGLSAAGSAFSKGVERLDILQNYPKVMQNLGYSAQEATASIKTISDHLVGLPSSTQELATFTQSIADSTHNLDLATDAALGFNDMLLASGAPYADQINAQNMLNKILGAGEVSAQRWTSLMSVMPAQLSAVSVHLLGAGNDAYSLGEALKAGTVSTTDLITAFAELGPEFEAQARAMTGGVGTAITNIPNRLAIGWASMLDAIGQTRISDAINQASTGVKNVMVQAAEPIKGFVTAWDVLVGNVDASGTTFGEIREQLSPLGQKAFDLGLNLGGAAQIIGEQFAPLRELFGNLAAGFLDFINGAISGSSGLKDIAADLAPFFGSLVSILTSLIEPFMAQVGPTMERIGGHLRDLWPALGVLGEAIANLVKEIAPLVAAIAGPLVSAAVGLLPILARIASVAVNLAVVVVKIAKGILNGVVDVFKNIGNVGKGFVQAVKNDWNTIKTLASAVWNGIKTTVTNVWNGIKSAVSNASNAVRSTVSNAWNTISTAASTAWNGIRTTITNAWTGIKTVVSTSSAAIKTAASTAWSGISANAITAWNGIKTNISTAWTGIKTVVSTATASIKTTATTAWSSISVGASTAWNGIKTAITTPINAAKTAVSSALSAIKGFFTTFKPSWPGIGGTSLATLVNNAKAAASSAIGALKSVFNFAVRWPGIGGTSLGTLVNNARTSVQNAISRIRSILNTTLRFPHISLPHFSVYGGVAPYGLGGKGRLPSFSVSWYARGGYVDSPLIGVGEAGREVILPVEHKRYMAPFAAAVAENMDSSSGVVVTGNTFVVREEADIEKVSQRLYRLINSRTSARL